MRCNWCHKEYATNAKLLQHHRRDHPDKIHNSILGDDPSGFDSQGKSDRPMNEIDEFLNSSVSLRTDVPTTGVDGRLARSSRIVTAGGTENSDEDELLARAIDGIAPSEEDHYIHLSTLDFIEQTHDVDSLAASDRSGRDANTFQNHQQINNPQMDSLATDRRSLLVDSGGGRSATVALVTADGTDTIAISIPHGQVFSLNNEYVIHPMKHRTLQ